MINYTLKIDFCDSKTLASDICFVSGDVKSSTLYFEFYNDGKRVDISGYILSVRARRSDGVVIASAGKIENNTAVFTPENNFYAVPGELYMEIALSDSTGKYVTTKIIIAEVLEGLGKAAVDGVDNLNVYVKLVSDAVLAKESAEAAAQIAKSVHPKIIDGVWWVYNIDKGELVSTGINAQGYTPIRGVDYWTEEDLNEICDYVEDSVNKNTTHRAETTLLCEYTTNYTGEHWDGEEGWNHVFDMPDGLANCDNVEVYVNGVEVDCKFTDPEYDDEIVLPYEGSFNLYFLNEETGEYDMYAWYDSSTSQLEFLPFVPGRTHIEIYGEKILELDEKYIPDSIPKMANYRKELVCEYTYNSDDFTDDYFPGIVVNRKLTRNNITFYVNGEKVTDLICLYSAATGCFFCFGDEKDYFYYDYINNTIAFYPGFEDGTVVQIYEENFNALKDADISNSIARTHYVDARVDNVEVQIGNIETALDAIIAIQNELTGGDSE